jgi:hypothetical protein
VLATKWAGPKFRLTAQGRIIGLQWLVVSSPHVYIYTSQTSLKANEKGRVYLVSSVFIDPGCSEHDTSTSEWVFAK